MDIIPINDSIPIYITPFMIINKMYMIFSHLLVNIILLAVLVLQGYKKIAIQIAFLYMKIYICNFGGLYDPQIIMKITTIIFILSVLVALNFHIIILLKMTVYGDTSTSQLNQLVTKIIKNLISFIIFILDCIVVAHHSWLMMQINSDNIEERATREVCLKNIIVSCLFFILGLLQLFFKYF